MNTKIVMGVVASLVVVLGGLFATNLHYTDEWSDVDKSEITYRANVLGEGLGATSVDTFSRTITCPGCGSAYGSIVVDLKKSASAESTLEEVAYRISGMGYRINVDEDCHKYGESTGLFCHNDSYGDLWISDNKVMWSSPAHNFSPAHNSAKET